MSLLLLFGSGGGAPPIATDTILFVIAPDEVATGASVRVWAEAFDNTGDVPLDAAPQITVWSLDNSGVRTTDVTITSMSASGEAYYYDWTPSTSGTYVLQVAGEISAAAVFNAATVTARPKFDPIALALHGTLVSRM
jgi:hypothetical protein